jgi:hypothetical protein
MFTLGETRRPAFVRAGLIGTQLGLPPLAFGLACAQPLIAGAGVVLLIGGLASSGLALSAMWRARRKRALEPGLRAFALGVASISLCASGGVALFLAPPSACAWRGASAYGIAAGAGTLALSVVGMLLKIIPFLVWMRAYGPRVGREAVPPAHTLGCQRWERIWLASHASGVAALTGAVLAASPILARAGTWLLALAAFVFCLNAARIAAHLRGNRTPLP